MSINKVIVTGNLTRDPEIRTTASGTDILTLGLAVNDRVKNGVTGEWEDYANFVNCVLFGKRAVSIAKIVSKGSKVAVDGRLRWSQWERNGEKRSKIEVIIDDIEVISKKSASNYDNQYVEDTPIYEEDIPF